MKGNNLFDGLNSGGVGKYKKVGDEAARRERAEKLDGQIAELNGKKRNYEWAEEALSFVEEQTKLNSDVFDISVNAVLLKQIKSEAQYVIDKKKAEDEARIKREKEQKEEEERKKREAELKRQREEEERRRIEAEKKREAERIEKEKEERWENDTAESTDKLIINLSLAPKSLFWCEDVKNAQNLVKSLSVKVRAKCKNLELLSELVTTSHKVEDASAADEFILQLEADCARDERNYGQVKEIEKLITDSCRPYMKEYERYKLLREASVEYEKQQKVKAEEKIKADREKAARIAKEAAELDTLRKKYAEVDAKIDDLDKKAAKAKQKKTIQNKVMLESVYSAVEQLLTAIPEKHASLVKKYKVLVNLKNEGKAYYENIAEQERIAALTEKAKIEEEQKRAAEIDRLLVEIDAAKRIKQTYEEIARLEKEVTPRMRTFLKKRDLFDKLTDESAAYFKKIEVQAKADAEKKLKAERSKEARQSRLPYEIPSIVTVILVAAAFAVSYFVPTIKVPVFYGTLGVLFVCSFIPYFFRFRIISAPFTYIYQFLVLCGVSAATFFLADDYFTLSVALGLTLFVFLLSTSFGGWLRYALTVLYSAGIIVTATILLGFFNVPYAGVIIAAGSGVAFVLLYMIAFNISGNAKALEIILYVLGGLLIVGSIAFTAIGGKSAINGSFATESYLGVAFGISAILLFALLPSFGFREYEEGFTLFNVFMFLCSLATIVTVVAFSLIFSSAGDGKTPFMLIMGLGVILAFLPFYVSVFVRLGLEGGHYAGDEYLFSEIFLSLISLSSLVLALVFSSAFSGRMVIFDAGLLFNGLVSIITLWIVVADGDFEDAGSMFTFIGGALSIFAIFAFSFSIPAIIDRVNETFGNGIKDDAPEAIAFVKQVLSHILKK